MCLVCLYKIGGFIYILSLVAKRIQSGGDQEEGKRAWGGSKDPLGRSPFSLSSLSIYCGSRSCACGFGGGAGFLGLFGVFGVRGMCVGLYLCANVFFFSGTGGRGAGTVERRYRFCAEGKVGLGWLAIVCVFCNVVCTRKKNTIVEAGGDFEAV